MQDLSKSQTVKGTYYERHKDEVRAKAKAYYLKITEGKVTRRNNTDKTQPVEKKPRGRPKKEKPIDQAPKRKVGRPRKEPLDCNGSDCLQSKNIMDSSESKIIKKSSAVDYPLGAYISPDSLDDIIFEDII